jgi:hypothetical protein
MRFRGAVFEERVGLLLLSLRYIYMPILLSSFIPQAPGLEHALICIICFSSDFRADCDLYCFVVTHTYLIVFVDVADPVDDMSFLCPREGLGSFAAAPATLGLVRLYRI